MDINTLLDDTIKKISYLSHKKGILVKNITESKIEISTDSKRLKQCLANLICNAVKFSEKGAVRDEGITSAEEDLNKLFAPSQRIESHLSVKAGGTGLGKLTSGSPI